MSNVRGRRLVVIWTAATLLGAIAAVLVRIWAAQLIAVLVPPTVQQLEPYRTPTRALELAAYTVIAVIAVLPTALLLRVLAPRAWIPWLVAGAAVQVVLTVIALGGLALGSGGYWYGYNPSELPDVVAASALSGVEGGFVIGLAQTTALWRAVPSAAWWIPTRMTTAVLSNVAGVVLTWNILIPTTMPVYYARSLTLALIAGVIGGPIQGLVLDRLLRAEPRTRQRRLQLG